MTCMCCGSAAVTGRPEPTARGYGRFRCRTCARQFNERSAGVLDRICLPYDIIALVVFRPATLPADPARPQRGRNPPVRAL